MVVVYIVIALLVIKFNLKRLIPVLQLLMLGTPSGWLGLAILQGIKEVPGGYRNPYSLFISLFGLGSSLTFIVLSISQGVNPIASSSSLLLWMSCLVGPILWFIYIWSKEDYTIVLGRVINERVLSLSIALVSCVLIAISFYIGTNYVPNSLSPLMVIIPLSLLFTSNHYDDLEPSLAFAGVPQVPAVSRLRHLAIVSEPTEPSSDPIFYALLGIVSGLLMFIPNSLILALVARYRSIEAQDRVVFHSSTEAIQFYIFWSLGISRGDLDSFFRFSSYWNVDWQVAMSVILITLILRILYVIPGGLMNIKPSLFLSTPFTPFSISLLDLFILSIALVVNPLFLAIGVVILLLKRNFPMSIEWLAGLTFIPIFTLIA